VHDDSHGHSGRGHSHDHAPHWIFKLGIFLNLSFFIADMIVWQISGSAAIFGDSLHNGLHALAHIFALHGHGLETNSLGVTESPKSKLRKHKAAQRIGYLIIAGALLIVVFGGLQIYRAEEVVSKWMIIMASLDIVSNAVLLGFLWRYREDPTVRAVFTDIKIDTLASVGVIASGIVILLTGYYRTDGIAAIPIAFIALYLARKTILEARRGIQNLCRHEYPP